MLSLNILSANNRCCKAQLQRMCSLKEFSLVTVMVAGKMPEG